MEPSNDVTSHFLHHSPDWQGGWECGVVYALMANRVPYIKGIYQSVQDEQLLVFASNLGYTVQFKRLDPKRTMMEFTYVEPGPETHNVFSL